MAFDETFRRRIDVDETEVYALTHYPKPVRELRPSNFGGPLAEWANGRSRNYGDTIIPRHVYMDGVNGMAHRVAWIYHEGLDSTSGIPFRFHHVACDCLLESEETGELDQMFECNAFLSVLNKRAWYVNDTYSAVEIRSQIDTLPDEALFGIQKRGLKKAFSVATIGYILEHDVRHPESWVGNVMDGEHQISLLSLILQEDPEVVREYAEMMQEKDTVEIEEDTIKLTQGEKDKIYAEQVMRSIAERVEEELKAA